MVIITTLFITMGAVSYAAYGSSTETVVLLNLPQDNKLVNGVQFLYSAAILLSTPLQIFPAIRITENALFTKSGKYNRNIKWQKNGFRCVVVMLCAAIAWMGADNLDKFVALVGNFACIPLVYIYPVSLFFSVPGIPLTRTTAPAPLPRRRQKQALQSIRHLPVRLWLHRHGLHHEPDADELGVGAFLAPAARVL